MARREVTLRFDVNDAIAGSIYELWLKPDGGSWGLAGTGSVDDEAASQDFVLPPLEPATEYTAQVRQLIDGRYSNDYAALNPSSWPSQSRLVFTTGGP